MPKKPKVKKKKRARKTPKGLRPAEENSRRGLKYSIRGTANVVESMIRGNLRKGFKIFNPDDILNEDEYEALVKAERHLIQAYKRLRQVEKSLNKADRFAD